MKIENIDSIIEKYNLHNKNFLTAEEVAAILEYSLKTVYVKLQAGDIPHLPRTATEHYKIPTRKFIALFLV